MLHVILFILKVLGITLLILIGVALLILLLALAAPFTYTLDAEYYGDVKAVGRIRWLCFVLDFKGIYGNKKLLYYLKSFGFTISTNDESDRHFQRQVQVVEDDYDDFLSRQEPNPEPAQVRSEPNPAKPERKEESASNMKEQEASRRHYKALSVKEQPPPREGILTRIDRAFRTAMEKVTTLPMRIHYKISEILSRILDFLANLKENISKLLEKKDEILKKVSDIRELLRKDSTKKATKDVRRYLGRILKHVRPRRMNGTVHFGMEDPSTTGQVLGAVSVLLPFYREHVILAPDFEQRILEGQLYMKGRIQIGFFLLLGLQALWNRDLMNTIQAVRTILGGNK